MDGKGRWRGNVFVEQVWKSIKYEEVYLDAYESVQGGRESIGRYLKFNNSVRPHSSLGAFTPDQVYFNRLPESLAA
jgi:putative transposase